jgi:signal transduction histidine kinase/ActR/RegA family two-component response regulator
MALVAPCAIGFALDGTISSCGNLAAALDAQLIGQPLAGTLLAPQDAAALLAALRALAPLQAVRLRFDTQGLGPTALPCDWHGVRLPADAHDACVTIISDAAEPARLQGELRQLREQQDACVSALSHELRDPLAPLRNAAYLLRNVAPDSAQRAGIVQLIERQIDQMAHRLDQLLEASRSSLGAAAEMQPAHAPVHLQHALREAVEQVSAQVEAAGHTLLHKVPSQPLRVQGDAARIAEMVATLLRNAVRFTPGGGLIELALDVRDGTAVVSVRDNGGGIAADELGRLFDGPASAGGDRSDPGHGLALATVRAIAAAHGGTVQAQSAGPGRGAVFALTLPLLQDAAMPAPAPAPAQPAAPERARTGLRVVVVDDNRDNADTLNTLLTMMGRQVRVGYDGAAALQAARAPFDAMLLDVGLPDIDGYRVAQQLRTQGIIAPLIAVSGYGQPRDKERALSSGFDKHLTKPVSIRDVATVLSEVAQALRQRAGGSS